MTAQSQEAEARKRLGFAEAVATHIAPVLIAHGFACTAATPYVVRFESPRVLLEVFHDRLSYEIEVAFTRKADPSQKSSLRDMLDAVLGPGHEERDFFQASEPDRVVWCVKAIADLLREHGQGALAGAPEAYRRMKEVALVRNEAYTKQVVQKPIRTAAEEAWRRRDYAKVRDLYASIEGDLAPVEQQKLKYARDH